MTRPAYTGVGARATPRPVCERMTSLASTLERLGYVLRSGAADGADAAFESGVVDSANAEI